MVWRSLLEYYDVISVLVIRAKLAFCLSRSRPTCQSFLDLSSSALIYSVSNYERFKLYLKDLS